MPWSLMMLVSLPTQIFLMLLFTNECWNIARSSWTGVLYLVCLSWLIAFGSALICVCWVYQAGRFLVVVCCRYYFSLVFWNSTSSVEWSLSLSNTTLIPLTLEVSLCSLDDNLFSVFVGYVSLSRTPPRSLFLSTLASSKLSFPKLDGTSRLALVALGLMETKERSKGRLRDDEVINETKAVEEVLYSPCRSRMLFAIR